MLRIEIRTGGEIAAFLDPVARLRIQVFRDFPYLYDGTPGYEEEYLQTYLRSADSLVVLAFDGDRVVGASTGLPLAHETEEFHRPFLANGLDPADYFYFGESVLERPYRGRGLGVRFFQERESHARRLGGFGYTCFCAVERPVEHPMRPPDYLPLDRFWEKRGYRKDPALATTFSWRDVGHAEETDKPLTFWLKAL
ncbi:MAG: GNAT family N-acetyltransferase [Candidatus Eremiobacterota bacterium]